MNIKELMAHVNDNIQDDRDAGHGLLYDGRQEFVYIAINHIDWESPDSYTLAPRKVLINGIECNAGMSDMPKYGDIVYWPEFGNQHWCTSTNFHENNHMATAPLSKGVLFDNEEDAIAMAKAMLAFKEV